MKKGDTVEIIAKAHNIDGKTGEATVLKTTNHLVLVELKGSQYWFEKIRIKGYEG